MRTLNHPVCWKLVLLLFLCPTIIQAQPTGQYGELSYTEYEASIEITVCDPSAAGLLEIPQSINGKPVTSIGEWAFIDCSALTEIIIPPGVISIGRGAFKGCSKLTNIPLPESIVFIGDSAFLACGSLSSIVLPPAITSIERSTFGGVPASRIS